VACREGHCDEEVKELICLMCTEAGKWQEVAKATENFIRLNIEATGLGIKEVDSHYVKSNLVKCWSKSWIIVG
jgi:hypothetical protein